MKRTRIHWRLMLLLLAVTALCLLTVPARAEAPEEIIIEFDAPDVYLSASDTSTLSCDTEEYRSIVEECAATLRFAMKARAGVVCVSVEATQKYDWSALYTDIFYEALRHTGVPTEGDYIARQYASCKGRISPSSNTGNYHYTYEYTLQYYSNAGQEAAMDTAVADLLDTLDVYDGTDYEKVRAIYDYMCQNIDYDYVNLDDSTYKLKYTAYAALINKTSVCQGYAVLFYRLALELGLDSRIITGPDHTWNIVKIGSKYYNLDATWDAPRYPYYEYFLQCPENFKSHTRDPQFTGDFEIEYPMASRDYDTTCIHTYGDWALLTAPGCTEQGWDHRVCSLCLADETRPLEPLGHTDITI